MKSFGIAQLVEKLEFSPNRNGSLYFIDLEELKKLIKETKDICNSELNNHTSVYNANWNLNQALSLIDDAMN
jgi:hypothetical protein